MKYNIIVREVRELQLEVEADNYDDALKKAEKEYWERPEYCYDPLELVNTTFV